MIFGSYNWYFSFSWLNQFCISINKGSTKTFKNVVVTHLKIKVNKTKTKGYKDKIEKIPTVKKFITFFNSSLFMKQITQGYIRKNGQKMQEMGHREEKRNSHPDRK